MYTVRMLISPRRPCVVTSRRLPRGAVSNLLSFFPPFSHYEPPDFMIRLAPFRISPARTGQAVQTSLFPDGLEHPKFKGKNSGRGYYVVCWKAAVEQLPQRSASLSCCPFVGTNAYSLCCIES